MRCLRILNNLEVKMKAKTTCLFLAIFLLAVTAGATEIPGGPVSGDWYASGNPYNINGDIMIMSGATLSLRGMRSVRAGNGAAAAGSSR